MKGIIGRGNGGLPRGMGDLRVLATDADLHSQIYERGKL